MRAKLVRVSCLVALAAAMVAPPILADDAAPAAISNIRQENGARATRLVVEASVPLAYTYYSPDPLTLVVDIPEALQIERAVSRGLARPQAEARLMAQTSRAARRAAANWLIENSGDEAALRARVEALYPELVAGEIPARGAHALAAPG